MVKLIVLLSLSVALSANAVERTLVWIAPTEDADNMPLPTSGDGAIVAYALQCAATEADVLAKNYISELRFYPIDPATLRMTIDFPEGTYYCKMGAENSFGWSDGSNMLRVDVVASVSAVIPSPYAPVLIVR